MVTPGTLVASLAVLFGVLFIAGFLRKPRDPVAELHARYLDLSRLTRREATRQLDERVEALTEKFPGKTYGWYLKWLVRDLERAKK